MFFHQSILDNLQVNKQVKSCNIVISSLIMKPFTLFYISSFAFAISHSLEHSKQKRSASPQLTINGDPNALLVGGVAAVGGGLLINHLLGDPAGKAVGDLINKKKNRRPHGRPQPQNVEHHHHHYLPEPEYETQEVRPYWSEWSGWQNGVCSRTCGTGSMNQRRTRQCSHGAHGCGGHADESRQSACNTHECPVDGYWTSYSEWREDSSCSRSCGGGSRRMVRHRQCNGPYGGGRPCVGSSDEVKSLSCNTQTCPTDGIWGPWQELSSRQSCRVTCGPGTVVQPSERKCIGPYNGGRPCIGESYVERCVEDHSHNAGGQYTPVPQAPRPSYGAPNSAISPRTLGDTIAKSDSTKGEIEKPVYSTPARQARKITTPEESSSSLAFYDGILTPSNTEDERKGAKAVTFTKPVYGTADRY